eukprot:7374272-Pyramimonas_sp.AAC.1
MSAAGMNSINSVKFSGGAAGRTGGMAVGWGGCGGQLGWLPARRDIMSCSVLSYAAFDVLQLRVYSCE